MKPSQVKRLQKQAYKTRHEMTVKLEQVKKRGAPNPVIVQNEESVRQINNLLKHNFS